ncbi:MAG TPA: metallophosphoesterase family protein [Gaiellaceae bacterium]|nr:metallophosphoesterase family protein [Gaiellaceae bacterium]
MRVAVLSDIHANLHALEAVLANIESTSPDEVWCLGDTVGYGAAPNECCARIRARADVMLCGNHDLAVIGSLDLAEFSGEAGVAARWTQTVISAEHREWLASLEPARALPGVELFHASPRDPVWDYVLSEQVGRESLELTTAPLVLVGHSHVALALTQTGDGVDGGLAPEGAELDLSSGRWLANPGSVGQPRDGDPRAAWLEVDFTAKRASFRRIAYDVEGAQAEIRAAGLPEALAGRLAYGL